VFSQQCAIAHEARINSRLHPIVAALASSYLPAVTSITESGTAHLYWVESVYSIHPPATVRAILHVGWRRQSLKVCNGDFILARATANYGCSTLTPAGPGVNVLTHEWPEVAVMQSYA
jgi:hypothetical protein